MNNRLYYQFLGGMLLVALASCETRYANPPFDEAADFYPLQTGRYIIYEVDSIYYRETTANDTASWLLKEVIADTWFDNTNRLNYRIERYIRATETDDWMLQDVWSAVNNQGNLERTEQNIRFVRLISPVGEGRTWKGHVYVGDLSDVPVDEQCNNLSFLADWDFTYREYGSSWSSGDLSFDSTVVVEQVGVQNLIEYNASEERWAKGVGMVYRYFRHFTTQTICPECPWEENTECGYSVKMTVVDYM